MLGASESCCFVAIFRTKRSNFLGLIYYTNSGMKLNKLENVMYTQCARYRDFFFPEPLQFKKITSNAHVKSQILVLVKKQLAFKVISLYPLLFALSRLRDGRIQTSRKHMRYKVLSCLDRPQSTVFSFSYKERQRNIHPTSSPGLFP